MFFEIVTSLIILLLPVAAIAAVVAIIVSARRRNDDGGEGEPNSVAVRRIFIYGIAFVALNFTAIGLSLLLGGALDAAFGDTVIATSDTRLAMALAFTVVGAPVWLILAFFAQRSTAREPAERRSDSRRVYLGLVRIVALVVLLVTGIMVGLVVAVLDDFEGDPWGWFIAWLGVWALHEALAAQEPPPTASTRFLDDLYRYAGALAGLYTFAGGLVATVHAALTLAYDAMLRDTLMATVRTESLREGLVIAVVGGLAWGWHWWRDLARGDARSRLWYAYLFLAGVTVAVGATVISLASALYLVLQWLFGDPGSASAADHFTSLPLALATLLIGAIGWGYHRAVLREGAPFSEPWSEPERIYRYLVAAAGVLMLVAGLVTLIAVAFDTIAPSTAGLISREDGWRNELVLGVTLVAIGTPLWARYWSQAQREVTERGDVERQALPRRVFVFAIFGLAALAVLIDLTIVLFQLFEGILDGTLSGEFLRDTRWNSALVLVAGAIGVQYWLVLREDQREIATPDGSVTPTSPSPAREVREITLLVAGQGEALVGALEAIEGVRVRVWRADGVAVSPDDAQMDVLRQRILVAPAGRLLVVARDGAYEVIPYEPV